MTLSMEYCLGYVWDCVCVCVTFLWALQYSRHYDFKEALLQNKTPKHQKGPLKFTFIKLCLEFHFKKNDGMCVRVYMCVENDVYSYEIDFSNKCGKRKQTYTTCLNGQKGTAWAFCCKFLYCARHSKSNLQKMV